MTTRYNFSMIQYSLKYGTVYISFICIQILLSPILCQKVRPNILLLVIDDLRPSLGCYGDSLAITPHIDGIAKEGILFSSAFAQQSLCGPSRTSFLTSRSPETTHIVDVHHYWRTFAGNFTTLPQYFKEHGYNTQSVGKIFHPGITSNHNDDQPYSWSATPYHPSSQKYKNAPVCLDKDGQMNSNIYCPIDVRHQPEKTLPDIQTTEFALKWLKHRAERRNECVNDSEDSIEKQDDLTKPFFLAVGFHKPHIPLKFPMEFLSLYPIHSVPLPPNRQRPRGLPIVAWNPWNDLRRRHDIASLNISFPFGPLPDFYSRYIRQAYFASISYTDSLVGLIIALTRYHFPNTIIALIGDHGWSLGEHQEWSKFSNFDVATRVPFIISLGRRPEKSSIRYTLLQHAQSTKVSSQYFKYYLKVARKKRNESNTKYAGIIELLDLFPTLVDLAGLPSLQSCSASSPNISTCTEGISLACIVRVKVNRGTKKGEKVEDCPKKGISLSMYPRPGPYPSRDPDSDQPRLTETRIMGYSLRTNRFRYTTWLEFSPETFQPNFTKVYGEELYDQKYDSGENNNLLAKNSVRVGYLREYLKWQLKG